MSITSPRTGVSAVYVISVASRMCNLHPQTLRTYERLGLLAPARSRGGVRLYSDEDLRMLMRIVELGNEGLNLEGIRRVLLLEAEVSRLRQEILALRSPGREEASSRRRDVSAASSADTSR